MTVRFLRLPACMAVFLLSACALGPHAASAPASFDFGAIALAPAATAPTVPVSVQLQGCSAPEWLAGNDMQYRLLWSTPLQLMAYRDSRWLAPPCALLVHALQPALRQDSIGGGPARTLSLMLDQFDQGFESAGRSHVTIRLRASLSLADPAQAPRTRQFLVELPATGADGQSGARALADASRQILGQVRDWAMAP